MEKISYDKIKELFIKYNYLPNEDLIWRTYISLMKSVGKRKIGQDVYSICLDGPAGTGKSSFAKAYSKILEEVTGEKIEFLTYSCNTKTGKEEVFEDIRLTAAISQNPNNLIIPGFIAQAIKLCNEGKKVVLRIDEYDKAKPETDSYLLEFLQEGRISTSQSGGLKLNNPENLQVILCKNDNRAQLSGPLTRRLNFINLDYTTPSDMASIVGMNMKEQSNAIKLLVTMMYSSIYENKDEYTRVPSASEVMIAIDEADILTNGGASKQYVYKSIINNLFKTKVDISTFISGNKKDGNIDGDMENIKMLFNNDSDKPFDKQALTLDLYEMYFKQMMDELNEQMQLNLKQICNETDDLKSTTDYRLIPVQIGEKSQSKFDLSSSWFIVGEIETNIDEANKLADKADEVKYDGPIFVIDDYYITVVKENLSDGKTKLKFLSNKPAMPTGVLIKLKEIIQHIECTDFQFSFPLISQYKFNEYSQKQNGFYEYSADIKKQALKDIFSDIVEIKLNNIKNKTGKIIDGTRVDIANYGDGDKAILKLPGKPSNASQNIKLDLLDNKLINEVQSIINIPFVKPIVVSKGKTKTISYDKDTLVSRIEVKSKKKGSVIVSAFEPEKIVEDLNVRNYEEAEELNESLLADQEMREKHYILKALNSSQKQYLSNYVDDEAIDPLNINEAVSNLVDYCVENDVLNENNFSFYNSTRTMYDILNPDIRTFSLRKRKIKSNNI